MTHTSPHTGNTLSVVIDHARPRADRYEVAIIRGSEHTRERFTLGLSFTDYDRAVRVADFLSDELREDFLEDECQRAEQHKVYRKSWRDQPHRDRMALADMVRALGEVA